MRESASRTPSASSISGTAMSPTMRIAVISGGHTPRPDRLTATPAKAASTEGERQASTSRARWSSSQTPKEKCTRLVTANITTAGASASGPKASTASGRPRLPLLLNIIGGTSVRGSMPRQRATAQPTAPLPASTASVAPSSGRSSAGCTSRPASAAKTSAGVKTSMLRRLASARSGR